MSRFISEVWKDNNEIDDGDLDEVDFENGWPSDICYVAGFYVAPPAEDGSVRVSRTELGLGVGLVDGVRKYFVELGEFLHSIGGEKVADLSNISGNEKGFQEITSAQYNSLSLTNMLVLGSNRTKYIRTSLLDLNIPIGAVLSDGGITHF